MAANEDPVYPDFFKVYINKPDLGTDRVSIPPGFKIYLPEPLPRKVVLITCGGNFWTVTLKRKGNHVYLDCGWKKFAVDNNLKFGEFLVFKYDGSRTFWVSIYGSSGFRETRVPVEVEDVTRVDSGDDDSNDSSYVLDSEEETEGEAEADPEEFGLESSRGKIKNRKFNGKKKKVSSAGPSCETQEHRGGACRRPVIHIDNAEEFLQDPTNPFIVTALKNRNYELYVRTQIVKDYDLKFADTINFIDPLGTLTGKTASWGDQRVCIQGWNKVCRRNRLKPKDIMICEFLRREGLVNSINVHIVRS